MKKMEAVAGKNERLHRAHNLREQLWGGCQSWREEARIDHLTRFCTALCGGDPGAGRSLAREVIWS